MTLSDFINSNIAQFVIMSGPKDSMTDLNRSV